MFLFAAFLLGACYTVTTTENEDSEPKSEPVTIQSTERRSPSESPTIEIKNYDAGRIVKIIRQASYEFYNGLMYRNPAAWKEKIVGVIGEYPGTGVRAQEFIGVSPDREFGFSGSYNGRPITLIVKLDHPLPMQEMYGKMVPLLSPRMPITVFGILKEMEQKMDENGYTRAIPTMECLIIYDKEDYSFKRPLWINSKFELLPEGTVTVDSLKYEFDRKSR
jgi:hypothetical protein